MNRMPTFARVSFAAFMLSIVVGCHSGPKVWVESRETLRFSPADLHTLAARTHNGRVSIAPAEASEPDIVVVVDKRAGGADIEDAEAAMAAIQMRTPSSAGVQHVEWKWTPSRQRNWGSQVSYTITMPPTLTANVQTHNGGIRVRNMSGGANLESHNAPINVQDVVGELSVRSHNGAITVENADGDLKAKSHNSPIEIRGHKGAVHARSHNGALRVDSTTSDFELITHNGGVRLEIPDGPQTLQGLVKTHNGAVSVRLPAEASTQLHASTHNGRISCRHSLADSVSSKRKLSGRIGGGAGALEISTHNGGISIR